jgi:hypothetical protein
MSKMPLPVRYASKVEAGGGGGSGISMPGSKSSVAVSVVPITKSMVRLSDAMEMLVVHAVTGLHINDNVSIAAKQLRIRLIQRAPEKFEIRGW